MATKTRTNDWRTARERADNFWTCDDSAESLTHDDLADAVEAFVDGFLSPGCDTEAILREKVSPLTIWGYTRTEVTDENLADLANDLADHLQERLDDDWCELSDPNGDHNVISDTDRAALAERFCTVLREERSRIVPWSCQVTTEVTVEGDELVAMVRELRPDWFEAEP